MVTKEKNKRKLLMLLDGNAIIHRAFHGVPPLTLADGTPSNAVYGFASTLLSVLEKFQPDYVVATFDLPGKTFRHDLYPEYKGKRKAMDEDLIPQFDLVKEVVRGLNIEIVEKSGFEADDVIGTLGVQATAAGVDTVIVTGDRDTLQLVDDHVKVFTMSRGLHDMRLYDAEAVYDKMGVHVAQVVDFKGICGDSSDNIPGVKGIGEKGAQQLLEKYGDLDGVYAHIDEISGAQHKKLVADKEMAYLSRTLGVIDCAVPVKLSLSASSSADIDFSGGRAVFGKFQFTSLMKRLDKKNALEGDQSEGDQRDSSSSAEGSVSQKKKQTKSSKKSTKKDGSSMENFRILEGVLAREYMGVHERDVVCAVFDFDASRIVGAAFVCVSADGEVGSAAYIPRSDDLAQAFDFFIGPQGARLCVYDAKALWHSCKSVVSHDSDSRITSESRCSQVELLPVIWRDVHLLAYSARTGRKIDVESLVYEVVGSAYVESVAGAQMALDLRDDGAVRMTCAQQAWQQAKVYVRMVAEMDDIASHQRDVSPRTSQDVPTVWHVFNDLEMPLARILYDMECVGIGFDERVFEKISTKTEKLLARLTQEIYDLAGSEFNINSTKQLRTVLFETLRIPTDSIKKTKTGFSTASSELEKIKQLHPIAHKIESYRELFKLKTTYIDTLPLLARVDSRIHTTYNQAVTSTGRLSSSDPNLQNIPVRTEAGRALREAFVARSGYSFISADYSQVELRCVAHVAQDKAMIQAFHENADIHTFTSARVMGKAMEDITKAERSRAKELNFGLIYGMGATSFAKASGLSNAEARAFIEKYFDTFHGVRDYMAQTKILAHENGFVETIEGRRYHINGIASKNAMMRAGAERAAINMPIQGLAAELMKLAMIAVDCHIRSHYPDDDVQMLLQVHDEIILEVPDVIVKDVMVDVRKVMEGVHTLDVPLVADAEIGQHWGAL